MKPEFSHASASFKARNPHLFRRVGGLRPAQLEPQPSTALDRPAHRKPNRPPRLEHRGPQFRISLVVGRARLLDSDNLAGGGLKALRDAIASSLGLDDSDKFITWEYGQFYSNREGVLVRIEQLDYM